MDYVWMMAQPTGSWWAVDQVGRESGPRYKQSEVIQLDDVTYNWKLEGSRLSWMKNLLKIQKEWIRPTTSPLENVGNTLQDMLKECKLESQSLKNGQKVFFGEMWWVFKIYTIDCLG